MVRRGHSLVELIVAMVVLATCLSAVAAGGLLAFRGTTEAIRLQDAAALAGWVLDSLAATERPIAGERLERVGRVEWEVGEEPGRVVTLVVRVHARSPDWPPLELRGAWAPVPPLLGGRSEPPP